MFYQMFVKVNEWLRSKEEGQTLIEYALLIVLIAIVHFLHGINSGKQYDQCGW